MTENRSVFSSARLRLAVSYAAFLVAAGAMVMAAAYVVLRYVPNYPLMPANPNDPPPVASRQDILEALLGVSAGILVTLAVVGMVGGWFLAGWILRPLRSLSEAARVAATGRLDHRVRLSRRDDEFGEVADSFDGMLERLQDAFATQERFAANASHELRTPLAVTATMLDVAAVNPTEQDYPKLLERLRELNSRAIGITEALLRLADANAVTAASEPVDLDAIVSTALTEAVDDALQRKVTLSGSLNGGVVMGDPALLAQLTDNLVRNAIRHNATAGFAWITTYHTPTTAVLRVENSGRDYTAAEAARLREPFLRGQGRTRTAGSGYGLGLALVARITAVHSGHLSIAPRHGGGLTVTITFHRGG
ncbi:two-component system sensor histidine kinase VanS [Stackebrandtia endophytica]|uniref:histidine kinase n=1 Tax=Stackebrandtia endophytica TaxID=1496996 RepID=A0A543AW31_9ACTN|nr:HAMP domain-containing sensor histidine kinase [Stackebrandtia endophytica]TQL76764.1 two-component system sensor histidine kinase VanS [Stackebrandtia endophytica]